MLRHGESEYNSENRFCGWHDADLSDLGIAEAKNAGKVINNIVQTVRVSYNSFWPNHENNDLQTPNLSAHVLYMYTYLAKWLGYTKITYIYNWK